MAIFYVANYRGNYACVAHMLRLMQTLLIAKKATIVSDDRLFIRFMIAYHALYHIWFSSYSHDVCDAHLDRVIRSYHAVMLSVIPVGTKIEMNIERDDRLSTVFMSHETTNICLLADGSLTLDTLKSDIKHDVHCGFFTTVEYSMCSLRHNTVGFDLHLLEAQLKDKDGHDVRGIYAVDSNGEIQVQRDGDVYIIVEGPQFVKAHCLHVLMAQNVVNGYVAKHVSKELYLLGSLDNDSYCVYANPLICP